MIDERDLTSERDWYSMERVKRCIQALEKHNFPCSFASNRKEACSVILGKVPPGATVGTGDSVTLLQTGIFHELEKEHQLFTPFRKNEAGQFYWERPRNPEEGMKARNADVFLTGINAITLDGKLINTDAVGTRIAGLVSGPRKVIVVAGVNKIVENLESAFQRIKNYCAPVNAKRHELKHGVPEGLPCAESGFCTDCTHPRRLCCTTVIIEHQRNPRIEVVLVGEQLGI